MCIPFPNRTTIQLQSFITVSWCIVESSALAWTFLKFQFQQISFDNFPGGVQSIFPYLLITSLKLQQQLSRDVASREGVGHSCCCCFRFLQLQCLLRASPVFVFCHSVSHCLPLQRLAKRLLLLATRQCVSGWSANSETE